ncbi:MAG: hypothetical protein GQ554_09025 [Deltaproteobacteria bacterium]|nr:hypothetical protein [Deltaproteobacteria bacterium]
MRSKIQIILILLFITVHSFLMNGYFYVHRSLNVATYVTPIVAQSDPSLFRKSLYVQSLKAKNARLSLMHDLSPYFIRKVDLETFSLIQWFICLFLTITALFYLGKTLIGTDIAGYGTALLFSSNLNNWALGSPAIYINFFHHGIQWAIMLNIFSLALIFKKKYLLAFFLMGIAWNFHPMSVIFLLLLFFPYWFFHKKECGSKTLLFCSVAFALPALPILIKSFQYLSMTWEYGPEWITCVKWTAWYTIFPSTWSSNHFFRAGLYFCLFVMGLYTLPKSEKKRDITLFVGTIGFLCALGTVFAEMFPVPFVMKMSLWRTSWIYIILSLPCIVHLMITIWDTSLLKRFLIVSTLIAITGYIHYFPSYYLFLCNIFFFFFLYKTSVEKRWQWLDKKLPFIFLILFTALIGYQGIFDWGTKGTIIGLGCALLFLSLVKLREKSLPLARNSGSFIIVALLFIVLFDTGILVYRGGVDIYYHGYVRGTRDPWSDIQMFAKNHSKKDDLFIVPPYINDFGLYSERATLGDWAEGANILYMDNASAKEWLERMNSLGWETFLGEKNGYNALSTEEIVATARKYHAVYIVTEKPKHFELPKVYENSHYILYRIQEVK